MHLLPIIQFKIFKRPGTYLIKFLTKHFYRDAKLARTYPNNVQTRYYYGVLIFLESSHHKSQTFCGTRVLNIIVETQNNNTNTVLRISNVSSCYLFSGITLTTRTKSAPNSCLYAYFMRSYVYVGGIPNV